MGDFNWPSDCEAKGSTSDLVEVFSTKNIYAAVEDSWYAVHDQDDDKRDTQDDRGISA